MMGDRGYERDHYGRGRGPKRTYDETYDHQHRDSHHYPRDAYGSTAPRGPPSYRDTEDRRDYGSSGYHQYAGRGDWGRDEGRHEGDVGRHRDGGSGYHHSYPGHGHHGSYSHDRDRDRDPYRAPPPRESEPYWREPSYYSSYRDQPPYHYRNDSRRDDDRVPPAHSHYSPLRDGRSTGYRDYVPRSRSPPRRYHSPPRSHNDHHYRHEVDHRRDNRDRSRDNRDRGPDRKRGSFANGRNQRAGADNRNNRAGNNNVSSDKDHNDGADKQQKKKKKKAKRNNNKSTKLPDGWLQCGSKYGDVVEGTRMIPMRTPLSTNFDRVLSEADRFSPAMFIEEEAALGRKVTALIDLTFTTRYYTQEHLPEGVKHKKIPLQGHDRSPSDGEVKSFFEAVDELTKEDPEGYIGVHCTHGINRTAFMICSYLLDREKISVGDSLGRFEKARGSECFRQVYLTTLYEKAGEEVPESFPEEPSWARRSNKNKKNSSGPAEQKKDEVSEAKGDDAGGKEGGEGNGDDAAQGSGDDSGKDESEGDDDDGEGDTGAEEGAAGDPNDTEVHAEPQEENPEDEIGADGRGSGGEVEKDDK